MERVRILASAAALKEFTAEQLAAFSGANLNTVRNVLHRNANLFEPLNDAGRERRPGRPANLYRVVDGERIEEEVRQFEQSLRPTAEELAGPTVLADPEETRLAAIVVAEDAAMRAWRSDEVGEKRLLAETAQRSLRQATADTEGTGIAPALARRAESASAFAALAEADAERGQVDSELVNSAWSALGEYAEVVPTERAQEMLTGLVDVALRHDQPPPLAVLTGSRVNPADALPEFGDDWIAVGGGEGRETLWAQPWARHLVGRQLLLGFVVSDRGMSDDELEHSLSYVSDWHIPSLVLSDDVGPELLIRTSRVGAFSLPAAESRVVAETLRSALDTLNGYRLLGHRASLGGPTDDDEGLAFRAGPSSRMASRHNKDK